MADAPRLTTRTNITSETNTTSQQRSPIPSSSLIRDHVLNMESAAAQQSQQEWDNMKSSMPLIGGGDEDEIAGARLGAALSGRINPTSLNQQQQGS
jgi:hypothetical protein